MHRHPFTCTHPALVYHYCSNRQRQTTKRTEFRFGRNRMLMLVRNYGFSSRTVLFLLTAPARYAASAAWQTARHAVTRFGHAAAYTLGVLKGIVDGVRNPVGRDADRFAAAGRGAQEPGGGDADREPNRAV